MVGGGLTMGRMWHLTSLFFENLCIWCFQTDFTVGFGQEFKFFKKLHKSKRRS